MNITKNNKKKIIRSAIGSLASIGFIKFLKENDFSIIGTDIIKHSAGNKFVDTFYCVSPASNQEEMFLDYRSIISKEKASCIISGPENEINALATYAPHFDQLKVRLFHPPQNTLKIITNKYYLYSYFKDKDISIPLSSLIEENSFENHTPNVILKPLEGRGSQGVNIIEKNKIKFLKEALSLRDSVVQDYIHGEEFTVDALFDYDGVILNIIPRKRIKTDSGISVVSQTVRDKKLIEKVMQVSKLLMFKGGCCFQFIKNSKGDYFLIDINPRFGGGSILSLQASKTFRKNTINLLNDSYEDLIKESTEFDELTMFRYYAEVFQNKRYSL